MWSRGGLVVRLVTVLALVGVLGVLGMVSAGAVDFGWARRWGGVDEDQARGVAVDGDGNVYTTGVFQRTVDFDPGPGIFNLTSAYSDDVFVSKLDAAGNLVWARRVGGSGWERGQGVAVDGDGNVYTAGHLIGTADFDPGDGTFNLSGTAFQDVFVSKLDRNGNFVWARLLGGTSYDYVNGVAVDGAGNVYTTGYFSETADFDPGGGTFNLTAGGYLDAFVSKLDRNGDFVWALQLGGASDDYGYGVAVDGAGNVYTTGNFSGTADFDPGSGTSDLTSAGCDDAFVSKLDASGNLVWARRIGGTGCDYGRGVAVDGAGNVFVAGPSEAGDGSYNYDASVSRLDASGNLVWSRLMVGTGYDSAHGVAVDGVGNVYTTGFFAGTVDFDPGSGTFDLTSAGDSDVFVSQLDAAGDFLWAGRLGGAGNEEGYGVAVDGDGNVYTTGYFYGTADFDPGSGAFDLTERGNGDVFVSMLTQLPADTTPPVASVANSAAQEGAGIFNFTVSLDKAWATPVSVDWATQDNTAAAPADYVASGGTVTFPAGSTTQTVSVPIVQDNIDEVNEAFRVQLSNPVNCSIGGTGKATGTIRDDDATPRITILGATWWENVGSLRFAVILDRPSSRTVTVNYATSDWRATAPGDYAASSGTVSFPPGSTVQYVTVPVTDDALWEGLENFQVRLSAPVFATLVPLGIGIGTIIDNDLAL